MASVRSKKGVFKKKNTATFRKEVEVLYGSKIQVVGDYEGCTKPIELSCVLHNNSFVRVPSTVLRGRPNLCPRCFGEFQNKIQRKSESVFREELKARHEGSITTKDVYVNTHTNLNFTCNVCTRTFSTTPNAILRLSGCPGCQSSKGEKLVKSILEELGIKYRVQKTYADCVDISQLLFDFYLPDFNILIEYDGIQHFQPVDFFGGEEGYLKQVHRDNIKNEYAINNNISLIRIPYTASECDVRSTLTNIG